MTMQMSEELLLQPVLDFSFAIPSAISQVVMLLRSSARFWTSFSLLASLILVTIPSFPGMVYALADFPPIDAGIRQTVLASLHEKFDKHLAQAENVRSVFIALNDEVFENRVTAVNLIGRLARHNPAYVMPSLRKALIQLLTELEYSTVV